MAMMANDAPIAAGLLGAIGGSVPPHPTCVALSVEGGVLPLPVPLAHGVQALALKFALLVLLALQSVNVHGGATTPPLDSTYRKTSSFTSSYVSSSSSFAPKKSATSAGTIAMRMPVLSPPLTSSRYSFARRHTHTFISHFSTCAVTSPNLFTVGGLTQSRVRWSRRPRVFLANLRHNLPLRHSPLGHS